jgi:hypothetical protein
MHATRGNGVHRRGEVYKIMLASLSWLKKSSHEIGNEYLLCIFIIIGTLKWVCEWPR